MTSISTRVRRGRISSMCTGFGYCRKLATDRPGAQRPTLPRAGLQAHCCSWCTARIRAKQ